MAKSSDASILNIAIDDFLFDNYDKYKKIRLKYKNKKVVDLFISSCKYCHKLTFDIRKAKETCSSKKCQRKFRNEAENKRQNSPYRKPITSIYNYISSFKTIFRSKVNDDPYWVAKLEVEEQRIKGIVKAEVKYREDTNQSPNDDFMQQFLIDNKHDFYICMHNLLSEYNSLNVQ